MQRIIPDTGPCIPTCVVDIIRIITGQTIPKHQGC